MMVSSRLPHAILPRQPPSAREDPFVLDLTSLIIVAGLFLGLVIGDAALFGDPVQVQISVPSKISDTGFTEAAAEQVFAAQVADMGQTNSIVQTPSVQLSTRPSILAAMAKPLSLDNVVVAIQSQAGVDVVTVHGAVMAGGTGNQLDMTMVVSIPREVPVQIRLSQADGDATALVQHAAESAMEFVSPYRLALTHFARGLGADTAPLKRAKAITTRALARTWNASRATEQVMLHNLAALMALLDNDEAEAQAQFGLTDSVPNASPAAHGVVELNRCFLAVSSRQTADAERRCAAGRAMTAGLQLRGWNARIKTMDALVAWSAWRSGPGGGAAARGDRRRPGRRDAACLPGAVAGHRGPAGECRRRTGDRRQSGAVQGRASGPGAVTVLGGSGEGRPAATQMNGGRGARHN
jgi:hypothetical protein